MEALLGLIPCLIIIGIIIIVVLLSAVKVVKEYERAVIFRLGKYAAPPRGPAVIDSPSNRIPSSAITMQAMSRRRAGNRCGLATNAEVARIWDGRKGLGGNSPDPADPGVIT